MIDVFWPSNGNEDLLLAVENAHRESALRENFSTQAVVACARLGVLYPNSIIGALTTLGGHHAPIRQAIYLLRHDNPVIVAQSIVNVQQRVPGWGNAFVKGRHDSVWEEVDRIVARHTEVYNKINSVTAALHELGLDLYPNAACYTAATAIITGMPHEVAEYLLIASRLPVWTKMYSDLKSKSGVG